ncbi:unnamed protein product [Prorocentrum cordatum]|uniref:Ricin B lectin domain-containing protein n=1 Tax=Prorocentrum cordatum TaxID=2364126 RepID=A0ABN9PMB6_9DINO|nr:unnamed protein product [Polarella glacialis]
MARLWLVASLVGARGVAGLGAATTDSSTMQFATAVDESSAYQQAAALASASSGFAPVIYQRDGKCLGVDVWDDSDELYVYTCNGLDDQSWRFANGELQYYDGRCVENDNVLPRLRSCDGSTAQKFVYTVDRSIQNNS